MKLVTVFRAAMAAVLDAASVVRDKIRSMKILPKFILSFLLPTLASFVLLLAVSDLSLPVDSLIPLPDPWYRVVWALLSGMFFFAFFFLFTKSDKQGKRYWRILPIVYILFFLLGGAVRYYYVFIADEMLENFNYEDLKFLQIEHEGFDIPYESFIASYNARVVSGEKLKDYDKDGYAEVAINDATKLTVYSNNKVDGRAYVSSANIFCKDLSLPFENEGIQVSDAKRDVFNNFIKDAAEILSQLGCVADAEEGKSLLDGIMRGNWVVTKVGDGRTIRAASLVSYDDITYSLTIGIGGFSIFVVGGNFGISTETSHYIVAAKGKGQGAFAPDIVASPNTTAYVFCNITNMNQDSAHSYSVTVSCPKSVVGLQAKLFTATETSTINFANSRQMFVQTDRVQTNEKIYVLLKVKIGSSGFSRTELSVAIFDGSSTTKVPIEIREAK
ncbi:MAG: hypothetical protein LBG97_07355 [Coriobacteriales bacterium]|jgi:hypothetical protein|nr:hypothetical protein [Coriobacteriales bacterium]